ncbi:hypothetical protein HGRIS_000354 [Hohenbuehelia grisea]|uniref:beta-glucosidase n=1 Tax=Hohenbuehelia grisea TaxID=104357 RepID=A0ABR3JRK6_9AGAR
MAPSDFAKADVAQVVERLTTDEAIQLIAGVGFWHTYAIPRLNIPAVKVSDGPNGIRGNHFFMGTPAKCLPSSTALGATWDTALVEQVGRKLLAEEAKLRGASVILAPTCNIQRSPLGGRSFESFAEDPFLSGLISAAYVKGVQAGGIGATIKHFVGNDKEDDRMAYDSIISPRALREVYLMPFMLAQKYAQPWCYMTAYNRVNGTHVSENPNILDILRDEWSFDGLVMSDWFGVYSLDLSIKAGLDLEMPGVNKWRTLDLVNRSIQSRKVTLRTIKQRATKVLELVKKCAAGAPEVLDGDGLERTVELDEDRALMRRAAAESIVLLKNSANVLPLDASKFSSLGVKKIAIVGGNAKALVLSGGGSAALKSSYFVSPYEGIVNKLKEARGDVDVSYTEGARTYMILPTLDYDLKTASGERGWTGEWFSHESDDSLAAISEPLHTQLVDETRIFISNASPKGLTKRWTLKLTGFIERPYDIDFEFGLTAAGRAKLFVDGQLVIDNWTRQRRGDAFFGCGTKEEKGVYPLKANKKHEVVVVFCNVRGPADGDEDEALMDSNPAVQLGGAEVKDSDEMIQEAVDLAKNSDVVIAVVGLNADWETEGYDRTTLALPGRTDELVSKVAAANPNTVVVTQSGSAITMPWVDEVSTIVHAWYLGNATGDAIADVLFGTKNPSGKLSLTFPARLEDVPSFGHFHSENGTVRYSEDLFVGYKHYQYRSIKPLFPFGHGLSYTTFSYSALRISPLEFSENDGPVVSVSATIANTGPISGSEIAQLYIGPPPSTALTHVPLQLKGFAKAVELGPNEHTEVTIRLDKYAFSFWDAVIDSWVVEPGTYTVWVGPSSSDLVLSGEVHVSKVYEWRGL